MPRAMSIRVPAGQAPAGQAPAGQAPAGQAPATRATSRVARGMAEAIQGAARLRRAAAGSAPALPPDRLRATVTAAAINSAVAIPPGRAVLAPYLQLLQTAPRSLRRRPVAVARRRAAAMARNPAVATARSGAVARNRAMAPAPAATRATGQGTVTRRARATRATPVTAVAAVTERRQSSPQPERLLDKPQADRLQLLVVLDRAVVPARQLDQPARRRAQHGGQLA